MSLRLKERNYKLFTFKSFSLSITINILSLLIKHTSYAAINRVHYNILNNRLFVLINLNILLCNPVSGIGKKEINSPCF